MAPPTVDMVPPPIAAPTAAPVPAPTSSACEAHPETPTSAASSAIPKLDFSIAFSRQKELKRPTDYNSDRHYDWCHVVTVGNQPILKFLRVILAMLSLANATSRASIPNR